MADSTPFIALLERVFGEAAGRRRDRVVERRIKESGLRTRKTLEAFEWAFQPKLDRALIHELARLTFVKRGENVILTGKTGTGKSHILQALALRACEQEILVRYTRCVDLLDDLHTGLADGSYDRRLRHWSRHALLVIDDVGLGQVRKRDDEPTAAHSLYNVVDRRHEEGRSTAITSNIALGDWGRHLGDTALTASILDRYRDTPGTTGRLHYSDRALAIRLYDRNISLATIDAAFVIAGARRTFRYDDAPPLGPIRSLQYFVPLILELLRQPPDPEYLRHLRVRLAKRNAR